MTLDFWWNRSRESTSWYITYWNRSRTKQAGALIIPCPGAAGLDGPGFSNGHNATMQAARAHVARHDHPTCARAFAGVVARAPETPATWNSGLAAALIEALGASKDDREPPPGLSASSPAQEQSAVAGSST